MARVDEIRAELARRRDAARAQEIQAEIARRAKPPPPPSFSDNARGVAELVASAGTGLLAEPAAGLSGLAVLSAGPEAAASTVQGVKDAIQFQPGEQGRRVASAVGGTIKGLMDQAKQAAAAGESSLRVGIGSLVDLAEEISSEVKASPDAVARDFGPAAGAVAKSLPAGIDGLLAVAGGGAATRAARKLDPPTIPRPGARRTAEEVKRSGFTRSTAKVDVPPGAITAVKDKAATEAIKQGFDDGVVAAIKNASPTDRKKMRAMVQIRKRANEDARFAEVNRAGDVLGDTLLQRVKVVRKTNREAGKQLDGVAKGLKGQRVDFEPAMAKFRDDLQGMDITIGDDLKPSFKGSDIEGLAGPENAVKRIIDRLSTGNAGKIPDAHDVHRMKKFIDETVTYGRKVEGLDGNIDRVLKNLRRNLDEVLDSNFPEYDRVNSTFSETRGVIDELQTIAGRRFNFEGTNADKQLGGLLRRITSNAHSRVPLMDAAEGIETVARKHAKGLDDDLITQAMFVNELERRFGSAAKTSFQGQTQQAVEQAGRTLKDSGNTFADLGILVTSKVAEKARGINDKNALLAIEALLAR